MDELNEVGEAGLLISVSLKNVMCHSELSLKLGPHVNFILGKNGSGKSAVLAAIIVALGGKTIATGRGLNTKNIIQKGKRNATVSVSLKNTGSNAFQHEVYGNVITIERNLSIDGRSSYKLKNECGAVVSTKKADLVSMLLSFNIQVDNPVAILTQDVSRHFLNSRNKKDKYALFFKATQLDVLKNIYKQAEEEIVETQNILECKEQVLARLKNEIRELEQMFRDYESLEAQKDQLKELYEEFAWSLAIENEQCVAELHLQAEKKEKMIAEHLKCIKALEADYVKASSMETNDKERITEVQAEINDIKEQQKLMFKRKEDCKQKIRENQNCIQQLNRDLEIYGNQISYLSKSITETLGNDQEDLEKKRVEHEATLCNHMERVKELCEEISLLEDELREGKKKCDSLRKELENCRDKEQAVGYRIEATQNEILKIRHCQSNSVLAYGKKMPDLLKQIKEVRGKFRHVPKGPIGQFVKVKDQQWALAVECCLGSNLLCSFLCDNNHDGDVLHQVIDALYPGRSPQIITNKFINKVYDVSSGKVEASQFCTILEMLDVDDPDIMNCLIDQRGVETIILIPTDEEARKVMLYNPPKMCTEAYTLKGNSVYPIPDFRFYANKKKTVSLISNPQNLELSISEKSQELELLKQEFHQCRDEIINVERNVALEQQHVRHYGVKISEFQSMVLKENAEIQRLEEFEEPPVIVHSLQSELEKTQLSLENTQNSKNDKELALKGCLADLKEVESEEEHFRELQEQKASELASLLKSQVMPKKKSLESLLREKNKYKICYEEESKKLEDIQRELANQTAAVKEKVATAEKVCPRIETTRKPQSIDIQIQETKDSIIKGNECQNRMEDLIRLHEVKQKEYEKVWEEIKNLSFFLKRLQVRVKHRLQVFEDFCIHVSYCVRCLFAANLHTHGYVGRLEIDHKEQTLEICAQPDNSSSMQNTKNLSGGEKSFVTAALLLSLWDEIQIPFRILDEYDIYMDQVNRKRIMDLMMTAALELYANQFIFLSPLEQVQIPSSNKIKLMYMPNPERQKRLLEKDKEPMDVD